TQSKNHAQNGNAQIPKNSIDAECYQPIAEHHLEIRQERDSRLWLVGLSRGRARERIDSLRQPTKIYPGENCSNEDAQPPAPSAKIAHGKTSKNAQQQRKEGNPRFRSHVRGRVDGSVSQGCKPSDSCRRS